MHVLVTCKYKKDRIKNNREKVETSFSHYKSNGGFLLPWKPEFWSNLPQNIMQLFTHPSDATHKIDQDWPTDFRDIQVWKCGWRQTDDGPMVYYKLTLRAFSSGELTKKSSGRWYW